MECAARVVELSPGEANFEDTYAWALHKSSEHAEALKWIELALYHEGDEPSANTLEHAGDILSALGKMSEAKARWQQAIDAGGEANRIQEKLNGK